ncbi:uncharacterized protein HGUI_00432 [Hanseniaspora guilliermondii]|uniref:Uncharacterized protein n=1 Tax=Hanseniaspora guilliermondii TaxID=56406 RepID=A0A1L0AVU3_9ASCO|nr:uncharacterized protein HGUI_00432 [Hanseniaspora guilliermondii]
MGISEEAKMNVLMLLKKYHDHMVEINNVTDLIKNYKLHFIEQSPLINQLTDLFSDTNKLYTEIIAKNGLLVKTWYEADSQELSESQSLINRKQSIKSEKIEQTIDVDNNKIALSDCMMKNSYYLDFSKQQRNKRLINEIKESFIKVLIYNVNELIKIKQQIMEL